MWRYGYNALHYFFYSPIFFIKSFVGLSMDGFILGMSVKKILALTNRWYKKTIIFCVCLWVIF